MTESQRFPAFRPFRELLEAKPRNGYYKAKRFVGPGTKYFRMGDLFSFDRVSSEIDVLQEMECSEKEIAKHRLVSGELLFCRTSVAAEGIGKCSIVTEAHGDVIPASNLIRASVAPALADPRFAFYYFSSHIGGGELRARTRGAAVFTITGGDIAEAAFPDLDLATQRAAADFLWSIDDLIENNRRRVKVLEEMARAIYREWFVHFRFPGHEEATFVDSDLGPIPNGWDVRPLFDAADVGFGFGFKSKRFNDEGPFAVIRIRNVPSGTTDTFTDEVADEKYRVDDGDILVGMDGEFYVSQWSGGDAWLNQRVTRIRPFDGLGPRYLMQAIEGPIRTWNSKIVGTTVAHLGKKHLQQVQVVVPDAGTRALSNDVLEPTALLIRDLLQQSRRLEETRDLILPKLVTGQIDVSDCDLDAVVEKAGV